MKKCFLLQILLAALVFSSCNHYKIELPVSADIDLQKVYLLQYPDGKLLDSASVNDGIFCFKGTAPDTAFLAVICPDPVLSMRMISMLVLEPGTISFDTTTFFAKGTKLNDDFSSLLTQLDALAKTQSATPDSLATIITSFVRDHNNDVLGAMWLSSYFSVMKMDDIKDIYDHAGPIFLATPFAKQIKEYLDAQKRVAVGQPFIDLQGSDANGKPARLADFVGQGKYVLVDFWASWCLPCRDEAAAIKELYARYAGDNFEVVGVAVNDKADAALNAAKEQQLPWPLLLDVPIDQIEQYSFQSIPQLFLFGPDGSIVARDLRGDALRDQLAKLFE